MKDLVETGGEKLSQRLGREGRRVATATTEFIEGPAWSKHGLDVVAGGSRSASRPTHPGWSVGFFPALSP
jgi:hypothetical protein